MMQNVFSKAMWSLCRNSVLLVFCAVAFKATAQNTPVNLVPNGGFEIYDECPNSAGDLNQCESWGAQIGSPDFFHLCGSGLGGASLVSSLGRRDFPQG